MEEGHEVSVCVQVMDNGHAEEKVDKGDKVEVVEETDDIIEWPVEVEEKVDKAEKVDVVEESVDVVERPLEVEEDADKADILDEAADVDKWLLEVDVARQFVVVEVPEYKFECMHEIADNTGAEDWSPDWNSNQELIRFAISQYGL